MTIFRDDQRSISHPDIVTFIQACDNVRNGGFISVPLLQTRGLFKYSKSLFITKWDEGKKDCLFKFWGSELTKHFGGDVTGQYYSEGGLGEHSAFLADIHKEVIDDKKMVYLGGSLDWRDKKHKHWDQVSMPLIRNGQVGETLTYAVISDPLRPEINSVL